MKVALRRGEAPDLNSSPGTGYYGDRWLYLDEAHGRQKWMGWKMESGLVVTTFTVSACNLTGGGIGTICKAPRLKRNNKRSCDSPPPTVHSPSQCPLPDRAHDSAGGNCKGGKTCLFCWIRGWRGAGNCLWQWSPAECF